MATDRQRHRGEALACVPCRAPRSPPRDTPAGVAATAMQCVALQTKTLIMCIQVLAIIVPRRTPKTTTFGKNFPTHGARLQPESASHGAPQARKQAIWGDLGRYSSQNRLPRARTPPKIASHEVVLRGTISSRTRILGGGGPTFSLCLHYMYVRYFSCFVWNFCSYLRMDDKFCCSQ